MLTLSEILIQQYKIETYKDLVKNYKDNLAAMMITYPNTNGEFQKDINQINLSVLTTILLCIILMFMNYNII